MARLAEVFSLIQQQQALEERKEERHHDLALQLLVIDINKEEKALDRQAGLIDRQLVRAEKKYDLIYGELETSKEDFSELTGQLYKAPDKDRTENAVGVVNDIGGPVLDSLNQLLTDTQTETQDLMTQKADISGQMRQARLIQDFYTGVGHDYSAGDPDRWDLADFSEEILTEYMAQYPELEGVDQRAFYKGLKTREEAGLFQNILALNTIIDQTRTAELSAATKELEYSTKIENIDASQLEVDIDNIASGIHSMISNQATYLNTGILSPAISATSLYAQAQEEGTGESEAKELQEEELINIGTLISGIEAQDESMLAENLRLGMLFVSGNTNYVNSIDEYLKGSDELNYGGWIDALQEVEMYSEYYKSQLEAGAITPQQYLTYKNNIEELVGDDLNNFSYKLGTLIAASEQTENKGQLLALKGMQDTMSRTPIAQIPSDTTRTDFDIDPNEYVVPKDTTVVDTTVVDPALKALSQVNTMTGAEFDFDRTYFQGRDRAALRAMRFPINIDPSAAVGDQKGQLSKESHLKNQANSIIGTVVRMETYGLGDESVVLDAKVKDGRIVVKVSPGIGHPGSWTNSAGGDIYLEDLDVISLQKAPSAMPTAFVSGVPYFYDPMKDKYVIQSNRLKD
jgi:hypothetical protein